MARNFVPLVGGGVFVPASAEAVAADIERLDGAVSDLAEDIGVLEQQDAGDIPFDPTETYESGSTGEALANALSHISDYESYIIGVSDFASGITYTEGYYLNDSGTPTALSGFHYSSLIPVTAGLTYAVFIKSGANSNTERIHGYDSNEDWAVMLAKGNIGGTNSNAVYTFRVTIPSGVSYIVISGNSEKTVYGITPLADSVFDAIRQIKNAPNSILYTTGKPNNLIVKAQLIPNYYINASGNTAQASGWNCTDFVDITGISKITLSGNVGNSVFYDSNKAAISGSAISSNGTFNVPSGAAYIRFSVINANKDTAMANVGANVLPYDDGTIVLDARLYERKTVIVDKNGGGDYTSLTEAVRSNLNNVCDYYVRAGVYDLLTEFESKYGAGYFDDMTSTSYDEGLQIQNGSRLFLDANAVVEYEYTGENEYAILHFSPFKFNKDGGELHGGQIICSNCRYAIHDDCYTSDYDNRITDGVYIYYRSDRGVAIGGGLGKSSHVELKNCYVDSELTGAGYGVFYHNNSQSSDAQNFVSIHDNYFTADVVIEPFGPSENMSRALVSNNKAHDVKKVIPSATDNPPDIDNFEMIAWNNVTAGG